MKCDKCGESASKDNCILTKRELNYWPDGYNNLCGPCLGKALRKKEVAHLYFVGDERKRDFKVIPQSIMLKSVLSVITPVGIDNLVYKYNEIFGTDYTVDDVDEEK